jgi:hypothetical protein
MFCNKASFYSEELLAPRRIPELKYHTLSAVCNCLFDIFTATLHIGGRSGNRILRTRYTVVTGAHLSREILVNIGKGHPIIWLHKHRWEVEVELHPFPNSGLGGS